MQYMFIPLNFRTFFFSDQYKMKNLLLMPEFVYIPASKLGNKWQTKYLDPLSSMSGYIENLVICNKKGLSVLVTSRKFSYSSKGKGEHEVWR
jgi:hypothetical protein